MPAVTGNFLFWSLEVLLWRRWNSAPAAAAQLRPPSARAVLFLLFDAEALARYCQSKSGKRVMTELPSDTTEIETTEARATKPTPAPSRTPAIIVAVTIVAIVAISLWYLVQPQPLVIQGEADGTRIDIAARIDGRVLELPVDRGQNVTAGQVLLTIDNPELLTRLKEAEAAPARTASPSQRLGVRARAGRRPPRHVA